MEPELKAALDALNMSLSQAAEAQAKALDEYRTASEANDKARDGVVDEKLAKLEAELIAIDGFYKTAEDMEPDLRGRAVQIWLEGEAIKAGTLG